MNLDWPDIETEGWLGGHAPVQAEGTIRGVPFYFRARWSHWTFDVGDDPVGEESVLFHREATYGEDADASWMSHDVARAIVRACAAAAFNDEALT